MTLFITLNIAPTYVGTTSDLLWMQHGLICQRKLLEFEDMMVTRTRHDKSVTMRLPLTT